MNSAEQIARQVRTQSLSVVITDICRDLGIECDHPLWRELQEAIMDNGGNHGNLMMAVLKRDRLSVMAEAGKIVPALPVRCAPAPAPAASGAGPPEPGVRTTIAA